MPEILIVEDEPAAARYLRSIIELKCPVFTIAGIAENGQDALDRIRLHKPDLVITDIKMPLMDGVELAVAMKREFPALPIIIASGYQDFEYARRMLDTGVVEYLLKPVDPTVLVSALERLRISLEQQREKARTECLLKYIDGVLAGEEDAVEPVIAPDELFWLGVVRTGGLPARFRLESSDETGSTGEDGYYSLPGCDSRERIVLGYKKSMSYDDFIERVRSKSIRGGEDPGRADFKTVLVHSHPVRADGLENTACEACVNVNSLIVAGLSQIRFDAPKRDYGADWDRTLAGRIETALLDSRLDLLAEAIRDMVAGWKTISLPLLLVESRLRRILYFIIRRAPHANGVAVSNLEFLLEEALLGPGSFEDIADAVWSLVKKVIGAEHTAFRDSDVPGFFHAITRYIGEHFSEPLTLGILSSTFRISPSYLSKLFRQHASHSFVEYVSAIRMEAAKELMLENPSLSLKEVAQRIGYSDPLYFSRVFKAYTGVPPSGFSRANDTEKTSR